MGHFRLAACLPIFAALSYLFFSIVHSTEGLAQQVYLIFLVASLGLIFSFACRYRRLFSSSELIKINYIKVSRFSIIALCLVVIIVVNYLVRSFSGDNIILGSLSSRYNSDLSSTTLLVLLRIFLVASCSQLILYATKKKVGTIAFLIVLCVLSTVISADLLIGTRRVSISIISIILWRYSYMIPNKSLLFTIPILFLGGVFFSLFSFIRELSFSESWLLNLNLLLDSSFIQVSLDRFFNESSSHELSIVGSSVNSYFISSNNVSLANQLEVIFSNISLLLPKIFRPFQPILTSNFVNAPFPNIFGELYFYFSYISIIFVVLFYLFMTKLTLNGVSSIPVTFYIASSFDMIRTNLIELAIIFIIFFVFSKFINLLFINPFIGLTTRT